MASNLFEQLTKEERAVVGQLVGVDTEGPIFRNYLRDTPSMDGAWTIGDAVRAYLNARLAALQAP